MHYFTYLLELEKRGQAYPLTLNGNWKMWWRPWHQRHEAHMRPSVPYLIQDVQFSTCGLFWCSKTFGIYFSKSKWKRDCKSYLMIQHPIVYTLRSTSLDSKPSPCVLPSSRAMRLPWMYFSGYIYAYHICMYIYIYGYTRCIYKWIYVVRVNMCMFNLNMTCIMYIYL